MLNVFCNDPGVSRGLAVGLAASGGSGAVQGFRGRPGGQGGWPGGSGDGQGASMVLGREMIEMKIYCLGILARAPPRLGISVLYFDHFG